MNAPLSPAPLDLVLDALREVLGAGSDSDSGSDSADAPELGPQTRLLELRAFDSLALASLVELLEARLGRLLPDEAIVPESFETPASIVATLVAPAQGGHAQDGAHP